MESYGISFRQALVKLDSDFHLGLIGKEPDYRTRQQIAENRRIEKRYQEYREILHQDYLTLVKSMQYCFGGTATGKSG